MIRHSTHAQNIPLLTELGNLFSDITTNMPALRAFGFQSVGEQLGVKFRLRTP